LSELRRQHPGEKIVAFTQFAETALMLFRELRRERGVAVLTARGARVAGGMLERGDVLSRFAPFAAGIEPPREAERVDLLITTDLSSEGVNLQDASVVVHLDLPWTPARLEQRVGRVARMGSRHPEVHTYTMAPPAAAESLLRAEQRLREKLGETARAVGVTGAIVPSLGIAVTQAAPAAPELANAIRQLAHQWARVGESERPPLPATSVHALTTAGADGFLALCEERGVSFAVASADDGRPVRDPARVLQVMRSVLPLDLSDPPAPCATGHARKQDDAALLRRWLENERGRRTAGVADNVQAHARRDVIRRIAAITHSAPPHLRPQLSGLASRARKAATIPMGAGAERILEELAAAELGDEPWLRAVGTFAEIHAPHDDEALQGSGLRVVALLSLCAAQ